MKADIRVITINETRLWNDEIQKACGKIETVYMYDKTVQTNCCEITPSYDLTPLYYITEKSISDEIYSEMESQEKESIYMHCAVVDELDSISSEQDFDFENSEDEEYKENFEDVREYLNCNHVV